MSDDKGKEVEASQAKPVNMTKKRLRQLGTVTGVLNAEFEKNATMIEKKHAFYDALIDPYIVRDENGEMVRDPETGQPKMDLSGMPAKDKRVVMMMFSQLESMALKFAGNDQNAQAAYDLTEQLRQLNAQRRGDDA